MTCAAVVAAAGHGVRLGGGDPKALRRVGGVPMLVHALRALHSSGVVDAGVLVVPPELRARVQGLLGEHLLAARWHLVDGGATRQESVANGLAALPPDVDVVLVHDAARPFVPADVVRRVVDAVAAGADAVVPVVPVADTIKQLDPDGVVASTPNRALLRQVQTPQGFRRAPLEAAYAAVAGQAALEQLAGQPSEPPATDDAGLVERLGGRVVTVDGDPLSFKVTAPLDLLLAEAVAASRG